MYEITFVMYEILIVVYEILFIVYEISITRGRVQLHFTLIYSWP